MALIKELILRISSTFTKDLALEIRNHEHWFLHFNVSHKFMMDRKGILCSKKNHKIIATRY